MVQMLADKFLIVMLETTVAAGMEENQDDHYLGIAHTIGLVAMLDGILTLLFKHIFFLAGCKFLAEIVCNTINFCNFGLGGHSDIRFNVIMRYYKIKGTSN